MSEEVADPDPRARGRGQGVPRGVDEQLDELLCAVVRAALTAPGQNPVVRALVGQRRAPDEAAAQGRPDACAPLGAVALSDELSVGLVRVRELPVRWQPRLGDARDEQKP